jgi:hypothetical protein
LVHNVEMEVCSVGVPRVSHATQQLAAPDSLPRPYGHASLLQVSIMNKTGPSDIKDHVVSAGRGQFHGAGWRGLEQRWVVSDTIASVSNEAVRTATTSAPKPGQSVFVEPSTASRMPRPLASRPIKSMA